VVFEGAHPRNVLALKAKDRLDHFYDPDSFSYLEVQQEVLSGKWEPVRTDQDPYTVFKWKRTGKRSSPTSQVEISWILRDAMPGTYRIVYNGLSRNLLGGYSGFTGTSSEFHILTD
jgi:neutral ceramidase